MKFTLNPFSPTFWSAIGGAASAICGALGLSHEGPLVNQALIALGTVLIGIPAHHTIKKAVAKANLGNA